MGFLLKFPLMCFSAEAQFQELVNFRYQIWQLHRFFCFVFLAGGAGRGGGQPNVKCSHFTLQSKGQWNLARLSVLPSGVGKSPRVQKTWCPPRTHTRTHPSGSSHPGGQRWVPRELLSAHKMYVSTPGGQGVVGDQPRTARVPGSRSHRQGLSHCLSPAGFCEPQLSQGHSFCVAFLGLECVPVLG